MSKYFAISLALVIVLALTPFPETMASCYGSPGNILSIAIDPMDHNVVYATTAFGGAFKSTDGGQSWFRINNGIPARNVGRLILDPNYPSTLYAGSVTRCGRAGGVFKSTDAGGNWMLMGLGGQSIGSLKIDPIHSNIIYVSTARGVLKSADGGKSWFETGLDRQALLAIDPNDSSTLYAAISGQGLLRSTDGGDSWSETGLQNRFISSLAIDPSNSDVIYAGTIFNRVFKTTDGANTWFEINDGLTDKGVNALAIDPFNSDIVFAGAPSRFMEQQGGVFKSTDAGATWTPTELNGSVSVLAIDPTDSNIIYAALQVRGIFKSIDGGEHWVAMGLERQ